MTSLQTDKARGARISPYWLVLILVALFIGADRLMQTEPPPPTPEQIAAAEAEQAAHSALINAIIADGPPAIIARVHGDTLQVGVRDDGTRNRRGLAMYYCNFVHFQGLDGTLRVEIVDAMKAKHEDFWHRVLGRHECGLGTKS